MKFEYPGMLSLPWVLLAVTFSFCAVDTARGQACFLREGEQNGLPGIEDYFHKQVRMGDLDGDGDLDSIIFGIGTAPPEQRYLYWAENLAGGEIWSTDHPIDYPSSARYDDARLSDLDGDLDLDLVLLDGSVFPNLITWRSNLDGKGTFGPGIPILSTNLLDWDIVDLNGDHADDLVVVKWGSVFWYANDGAGNVAGAGVAIEPDASLYYDFTFSDMDGDDDADIAATYDNNLLVLRNEGYATGMFTTIWTSTVNGTILSTPAIADLNSDTYADVAIRVRVADRSHQLVVL